MIRLSAILLLTHILAPALFAMLHCSATVAAGDRLLMQQQQQQQSTFQPAAPLVYGNASATTAGVNASLPGYPNSGGLLTLQLQPLLVAIQTAHLYNDSKTAV